MSRGRSSSSSSRGSSSSGFSSRGSSSSRGFSSRSSSSAYGRSYGSSYHHTTVFIGGGSGSHSFSPGSGKIFLAVVLLLIGSLFLFFSVPSIFTAFEYGKVDATCVDNYDSGMWYYSVYEYEVDGKQYIERSDVGWEKAEQLGKVVEIWYLKDNPNFITDEEPVNVGATIAFIVIGVGLVAGGVLLIKSAIKNKKQLAEGEEDSFDDFTNDVPQAQPEEKHTTCAYCGSKYDKNLSACPRCGAGKN